MRKLVGSAWNNSRVEGSSNDRYVYVGNALLMSVDFPLWRGPVTETTGNYVANCNSFFFISRKIMSGPLLFTRLNHTEIAYGFIRTS